MPTHLCQGSGWGISVKLEIDVLSLDGTELVVNIRSHQEAMGPAQVVIKDAPCSGGNMQPRAAESNDRRGKVSY